MPVTHMADEALRKRGGVIASYFEWVQNIQQFPWERTTLLERLERAYAQVIEESTSRGTDLRTAAYELAIERVLRAVQLRGF